MNIGQLRREAEGARDVATGYGRDHWTGYLRALDDVQESLGDERRDHVGARVDIVEDLLNELSKMAQDNILRGSVNSFELRDKIDDAKRRLADAQQTAP